MWSPDHSEDLEKSVPCGSVVNELQQRCAPDINMCTNVVHQHEIQDFTDIITKKRGDSANFISNFAYIAPRNKV